MKKVWALSISILMIFLVLASGCLEKQEQASEEITEDVVSAPEEVVEENICDDFNDCTKDIYTEEGGCEYVATDDCCGNDICEEGERCNEKTHTTNCIEDCSRTCPAYLIVHGEENEGATDPFALDCADDNCEKINDIKFSFTDSSRLKLTVTNLGERTSPKVSSYFMCWSGEEQVHDDDRSMYGVVFSDYFNDGEEEADSINAVQSGNNFATYYLSFDTDNLEKPYLATCQVTLRATDLEYKQTIGVSFI